MAAVENIKAEEKCPGGKLSRTIAEVAELIYSFQQSLLILLKGIDEF